MGFKRSVGPRRLYYNYTEIFYQLRAHCFIIVPVGSLTQEIDLLEFIKLKDESFVFLIPASTYLTPIILTELFQASPPPVSLLHVLPLLTQRVSDVFLTLMTP